MSRITARVTSVVAALSLALLWAVVVPSEAHACSCSGISSRSALDRADAVFSGRVLSTDRVRKPGPGHNEIRFQVARVYKGDVYAQQVVTSPLGQGGCGINPQVDSSWVIFAEERIEGNGAEAVFRLVTEICSGNLPGSGVPLTLGRGQPPKDGESDREEKAVATDASVTRVLKVGGVVGLALALMAGVGLGFLWRPGRQDG